MGDPRWRCDDRLTSIACALIRVGIEQFPWSEILRDAEAARPVSQDLSGRKHGYTGEETFLGMVHAAGARLPSRSQVKGEAIVIRHALASNFSD